MSRSALGGVLLVMGLGMLILFSFGLRLPDGLRFGANLMFGVIPTVVGAALLWSGRRLSSQRRDPETLRINAIKDQIIWRAMALGGRITSEEAATHAGLDAAEVEGALLLLVSEGRVIMESDEAGAIVYRVEGSITPGSG